jgi:hypothetical protein
MRGMVGHRDDTDPVDDPDAGVRADHLAGPDAAVRAGYDTDTVAAITGSLLGAAYGASASAPGAGCCTATVSRCVAWWRWRRRSSVEASPTSSTTRTRLPGCGRGLHRQFGTLLPRFCAVLGRRMLRPPASIEVGLRPAPDDHDHDHGLARYRREGVSQ